MVKMWPRPKLAHLEFKSDSEISYMTYQAHRSMKGILQAAISFFIGLFMAAGGTRRWNGQSLEVAMGFPWAPVLTGGILVVGSTILWGAVISNDPRLRWYGSWMCGLWHYTMMVFAIWKFFTSPTTVDDVAFFLWFFLAMDYTFSALLSISWTAPTDLEDNAVS